MNIPDAVYTAEPLRQMLADLAREEVLVARRTDGVAEADRPQVVIERLQRGEAAGPEYMALQNVLSVLEELEAQGGEPVKPESADVLGPVEEQRGKLNGYRQAAMQLRGALFKGLQGKTR